jgi:hypothetical protein
MKVALLLFGQPRYIENLKVFNSHLEHIISKYETDVFCHTYFDPDHEFIPSCWSQIKPIKCNPNSIHIIEDNYKPKKIKVDAPKTFNISNEIVNSSRFKKFNFMNELNTSNLLSQLYSINCVSELFETYCNDTNTEYDFVIVARYDSIILEFPSLFDLDSNFFYSMNHHPRFPDIFFIFHPKFIQSQHTFKNVDLILDNIVSNKTPDNYFWDFSGECMKFNNFMLYFSPDLIKSVYIKELRNNV